MTKDKDVLLKVRDLKIEGFADEKWVEIVHGVDLTLHEITECRVQLGLRGGKPGQLECRGYAMDWIGLECRRVRDNPQGKVFLDAGQE